MPLACATVLGIWIIAYLVVSDPGHHKGPLLAQESLNPPVPPVIVPMIKTTPDYHFATMATTYLESGRKVKRIHVVDRSQGGDAPLKYARVVSLLKTDAEFRDDFFDVLRRGLQSFSDGDVSAYFFETPPVNMDNFESTDFEFVLIAAQEFSKAQPDVTAFEKYFDKCSGSGVVSFHNLGKDAMLVVPCLPQKYESLDTFAHLANFMRTGSEEQMHDFWIEVATQMEKRVAGQGQKKVWLSTCGLGIFWLHMRLDGRPKYYSFPPFRDA